VRGGGDESPQWLAWGMGTGRGRGGGERKHRTRGVEEPGPEEGLEEGAARSKGGGRQGG
jgi:hypothetical protein